MRAPPYDPLLNAQRSGYTTSGFADRYDAYRPKPPGALLDMLPQLAWTQHPTLVVDLGSGTGLSTAVWAERAQQVVGIEPLDEMRRKAEANNTAPQVRFQFGFAHQTGLPGGSADIVTCSQALHWMEPESTFTEVARILRPGGVFAAYDYDWPPTVHWEAERAFLTFMERIRELRNTYTITSDMQQWAKHEHLARMRASQRFRYVKEILLHNTEPCTAERWAGFALTLGHVVPVLTLGLSDTELGLDEFRHVAQQTLGNKGLPWYVSYRIRVGVK